MEWLVVFSLAVFLVGMILIARDASKSIRSMEEKMSAESDKAPD